MKAFFKALARALSVVLVFSLQIVDGIVRGVWRAVTNYVPPDPSLSAETRSAVAEGQEYDEELVEIEERIAEIEAKRLATEKERRIKLAMRSLWEPRGPEPVGEPDYEDEPEAVFGM